MRYIRTCSRASSFPRFILTSIIRTGIICKSLSFFIVPSIILVLFFPILPIFYRTFITSKSTIIHISLSILSFLFSLIIFITTILVVCLRLIPLSLICLILYIIIWILICKVCIAIISVCCTISICALYFLLSQSILFFLLFLFCLLVFHYQLNYLLLIFWFIIVEIVDIVL